MIPQNVKNINKTISGNVFHLFYPDLHTSILFDKDLTQPIICGSKNVVMSTIKKLDELMNVKTDTKVRIYTYIIDTNGYRRIHTYNGPIETIGKYIIKI